MKPQVRGDYCIELMNFMWEGVYGQKYETILLLELTFGQPPPPASTSHGFIKALCPKFKVRGEESFGTRSFQYPVLKGRQCINSIIHSNIY